MKHGYKTSAALISLLLALSILLSACSGTNTTPPVTPTETTSAELPTEDVTADTPEDVPYTIEYIYTRELITPYYPLYGSLLDDFVEIYITNNSDVTSSFLVETEIDGYSSVSSDTVEVAPGERLEIRQNPRLVPESMEKLNSQRYANFVIRVTLLTEGEGDLLLSESNEILLYSRRDYAWVSGFDEQGNRDLLAVYVTPNDPAVEELLRRAANYTSSGEIWSGYGGHIEDDNGGVLERLQAVWQAEKEYNLTYVSTWVSFTPEASQRMRLPFEVLEQEGGNCIELVFLYASAVEAMDLEPAIVLIPGHAYLAVRTDQENASYYFIETTLIGQTDFDQALAYGNNSWETDGPKLDAGEEAYGWVTIPEAREQGILPLPWR